MNQLKITLVGYNNYYPEIAYFVVIISVKISTSCHGQRFSVKSPQLKNVKQVHWKIKLFLNMMP